MHAGSRCKEDSIDSKKSAEHFGEMEIAEMCSVILSPMPGDDFFRLQSFQRLPGQARHRKCRPHSLHQKAWTIVVRAIETSCMHAEMIRDCHGQPPRRWCCKQKGISRPRAQVKKPRRAVVAGSAAD